MRSLQSLWLHSFIFFLTQSCWEKRYHSTGFPRSDDRRALNTLHYIHGNPKAAGIPRWFHEFSNYGIHDRLTDDGLTEWHPAFLDLGETLDECAEKYRQFCQRYRPKPKSPRKNHWGKKKLAGLIGKGKQTKKSPGQMTLLWDEWDVENHPEIQAVAKKFVEANGFKRSHPPRGPTVPGNGIP